MASGPDLFVICKSCGSEVSPYITECPYCGTRLRKRAPKLERGGVPKPPKPPRRARPRLQPLRHGEIPGIRADRRPYVTIALVLAAAILSLVARFRTQVLADLLLAGPVDGEWWRLITTQFLYGSTGYEVAALGAVFLFGWLLERRHGWWAPLFVFLLGGTAGMYLSATVDGGVALGGNAAALALLAAWSMRDVLGRRAGREDDADLLGVLAIAVLLVLLPLATTDASALAGLGGGAAGIVLGLVLARLRER
ncbi:MAG TPA: rhomboid family intramembrane serine protease [Solirubrobacteraceae bacterium]|nr:rhomboid family intramembrane serine protease [Solirubrobacteraceae bacterium]